MRYVLSWIATVAWALWFGGLMALFVFVQAMFHHDRPVAVKAAPMLFAAFEVYQLVLAAVAVIATFAWWLTTRSRWVVALFVPTGLAVLAAVASMTLVTPKMEALRLRGESGTPAFRALHGRSMMLYSSEAVVLLAAGLVLPGAIRATTRPAREGFDARSGDAPAVT